MRLGGWVDMSVQFVTTGRKIPVLENIGNEVMEKVDE